MIKCRHMVSAIGAASMLALVQPASAALLTATVSGTVTPQAGSGDAFDVGVFGTGYQSLVGRAFSVTYIFDLDDAAFQASYVGAFSPVTAAAGGAWSPVPSASFGQAALTIGARTVTFAGISFGGVTAGTGERTFDIVDFSQPGIFYSVATNLFDASLSFPALLASAGGWRGTFDHAADLASSTPSSFFIAYGDGRLAGAGLAPTSVTIAISAVPEIDSWIMMIAGFGVTGVAMRRRRRSPLPA